MNEQYYAEAAYRQDDVILTIPAIALLAAVVSHVIPNVNIMHEMIFEQSLPVTLAMKWLGAHMPKP